MNVGDKPRAVRIAEMIELRKELLARLARVNADLRDMGVAVPEAFSSLVSAEEDDPDDPFDNLPV